MIINCRAKFFRLLWNSSFATTNRHFSVSSLKQNETYSSQLFQSYYNEQQKQMQATCTKIIDADINPYVDEWEAKETFPVHQLVKKFGQAGILGVDKIPEYGGLGLNIKYKAAIVEQLGVIRCAAIPAIIMAQMGININSLAKHGSEDLKREFLVPSIAGDMVSCIAVTEQGAGSDVANIQTTAVRKGDDLVINGQKLWISNSFLSDWICLLANTSKSDNPYKNKSLICVPTKTKGITMQRVHKICYHSSESTAIFFDNVKIPAKYIIGNEGLGFKYQMIEFQEERLTLPLNAFKAMDHLLSITMDFTRERKAFGKSILDNQSVYFRLAELAAEVESLRALTYNAINLMMSGEDVTLLASMTKLKAGRLARVIGDACLQYWGGMGLARESYVSRFYRDYRMLSIAGGADEIMLEIIAKRLGMSPTRKN